MNKLISTLIFMTLITAAVFSQDQGIDFFEGSWQEALDEAEKQGKPVFVDAYAVWCGPCKWMDANVFPSKSVGEFYNKHFINYKFDMERGEGPAFAQEYGVRAYPTLLYLDADGEVKYRIMGGRRVDDFIKEGEKALQYFE